MKSIELLKAINFIDDVYIENALTYRKGRKRRVKSRFSPAVYIKRAAVIILIVIPVTFGLLMIDDGIRATVVNTVVTWYDKYVKIDFSKSTESPETGSELESSVEITDFTQPKVGYVPEGYDLASTSEDTFYREYVYLTETGDYILIGFYDSDAAEYFADSEYMKYEKTTVNGYGAYLFFSEEDGTGSLTYGNSNFYVVVSTSALPKEELIKVGESIK